MFILKKIKNMENTIVKRLAQILLILFLLLPYQAWSLDVIPGLKIFGGTTRAAYGNNTNPSICIVNTLNPTASITNSTRNGVAVKTGGLKSLIDWNVDNKMILFEVSGAIVYYGRMIIDNNYVTIAGQTAPSPGISVYGTHFDVTGNHVLIQHVRIRVGDNAAGISPDYRNCVELYGSSVIFDHCSFSWSTDTLFSISGLNGGISNVTLSNSILSEPLYDSLHSKGPHSTSLYILRSATNIGVINNLIAHSDFRNPTIADFGNTQQILVANNIIYNGGAYNIQVTENTAANDYNIVGNITISGANTGSHAGIYIPDLIRKQNSSSNFYIYDNRCDDGVGGTYTQSSANDWSHVRDPYDQKGYIKVTSPAFSYPKGYTPMASNSVEAYITSNVGARPVDRDSVDTRIINDLKNRTGKIIDSVSEVGGWPVLLNKEITLSIPGNPNGDDDGDGYTNLEEWLHGLASHVEGKGTSTLIQPPAELKIKIQ